MQGVTSCLSGTWAVIGNSAAQVGPFFTNTVGGFFTNITQTIAQVAVIAFRAVSSFFQSIPTFFENHPFIGIAIGAASGAIGTAIAFLTCGYCCGTEERENSTREDTTKETASGKMDELPSKEVPGTHDN